MPIANRLMCISSLGWGVVSLLVSGCGGSGDTSLLGTPSAGGAAQTGGASGLAGKGGAHAGAGGANAAGKGGAPNTGGTAGNPGNAGTSGNGGAAGMSGGPAKGGASGASGASGKGGSGGGTAGAGAGQAGTAGKGTAASGGAAATGGSSGSAGGGCVPKNCAALGSDCGPIGDGCGTIIDCGQCPTGSTCGGGGIPSICGTPPCAPKTCADLAKNCGPAGDGCGGVVDCGACAAGEICGGGAMPGVCGTAVCVPISCATQGISCGPSGDGCGGQLDCGTCPAGQSCGGGGVPGACGASVCKPKTCADLGFTCGPAPDGCGALLQCGTCSLPEKCGANAAPNTCGTPTSCTGLCLQQVSCPNGGTTTISGTVYAPNGVDPLPNAAVYVPNAPVQPFVPGVSCDTCGAPASGSPLVSAVTAVDGKFTLSNVPVGINVPIVIQIGRWRRQVTIPSVTACQDTPVAASLTHLPKNQSQGDIPLMAFATGQVDALECVLRKVGVDDKEFTKPTGAGNPAYVGRIHLYTGSGSSGADAGNQTPTQDKLVSSLANLSKYDIVLFPCQGGQFDQTTAAQTNLINYMNAGGRLFATHFSYVWLYNDAPFSSTATWNNPVNGPNPIVNDPQTGYIDMTFPKGAALAQWLQLVGASTILGQIDINTLRDNFSGVVAPSQLWMTIQDPSAGTVPMHYTFNTPVGQPPAQQCGRVVYDDFHVEEGSFGGTTFPDECNPAGPMTPQEKLLEFMLFDLASCVAPDVPTCTASTCAAQGVQCGPAGDGCGAALDCGTCAAGQTCGGGGVPSVCGAPSCTPTTCVGQGVQCGPAGDGCGNLLQCGSCPSGQTCGGGGKPGVCGSQGCAPLTCVAQNIQCGPAGDGCGGLLQCGSCLTGQTCGGGGVPGACGAPPCVPTTCVALGTNCGPAGDGCGGLLQCGTCMAPQTCGGGTPGTPGVCGGNGKP